MDFYCVDPRPVGKTELGYERMVCDSCGVTWPCPDWVDQQQRRPINATVTDPDDPLGSPAYDGEPAGAHQILAAGEYSCTFMNSNGDEWPGRLVVTATATHAITSHTNPDRDEVR